MLKTLPAWTHDSLPAPPVVTVGNVARTIGPGAILLATSMGGGEWLVGPAISVRSGVQIMWIATVAIALQLVFNLESIRYTLYTGEPIITGFMRLKPSSRFWAMTYSALAVAQLGMPALAAACASVLFATFAGHLADAGDVDSLHYWTYGVMILAVVILCSGRTVERMLEIFSWVMIGVIFSFLLIVNVIFVPAHHWLSTLLGFFHFGYIPQDVDMLLIGTLAATAGSGGVGNLVISNWYRDKGFGMGQRTGEIGSAFSKGPASGGFIGCVFEITADNLRNWRGWWYYVIADQVGLWAVGCFVGMYLNVNLATAIIPHGTDLDHMAAGAFQAQYLAEQLWPGFWFLALANGFWVLFSTYLGDTDILVRTVTDIFLVGRSPASKGARVSARSVYYTLLCVFFVWSLIAVHWGHAMTLFKVLGVFAGPILALSSIQVLVINSRLLPSALRPSVWRRCALVACAGFFVSISVLQIAEFLSAE